MSSTTGLVHREAVVKTARGSWFKLQSQFVVPKRHEYREKQQSSLNSTGSEWKTLQRGYYCSNLNRCYFWFFYILIFIPPPLYNFNNILHYPFSQKLALFPWCCGDVVKWNKVQGPNQNQLQGFSPKQTNKQSAKLFCKPFTISCWVKV